MLASLTGHLDTLCTKGLKTKKNVSVLQFESHPNRHRIQWRSGRFWWTALVPKYINCNTQSSALRYKKFIYVYIHCCISYWPQNSYSHFRFLLELSHEALYLCSCVAIDCLHTFECINNLTSADFRFHELKCSVRQLFRHFRNFCQNAELHFKEHMGKRCNWEKTYHCPTKGKISDFGAKFTSST